MNATSTRQGIALALALDVLLLFVALNPVVTAALWIAGGVMFKLLDERPREYEQTPAGGWPGVTILIRPTTSKP
jgi:biofilm PGA synthesis N-glycosyltransferase PgaC